MGEQTDCVSLIPASFLRKCWHGPLIGIAQSGASLIDLESAGFNGRARLMRASGRQSWGYSAYLADEMMAGWRAFAVPSEGLIRTMMAGVR
jgi:hypothetical protein